MHIAFVASESVPFSKTGGLADVVSALPQALISAGHQVSVYLPLYRQTKLKDPQTVVRSITVPFDDRYRFCSVVSGGKHSGVQFYFVDYPPFFDRDALYGFAQAAKANGMNDRAMEVAARGVQEFPKDVRFKKLLDEVRTVLEGGGK